MLENLQSENLQSENLQSENLQGGKRHGKKHKSHLASAVGDFSIALVTRLSLI
jgi:hypothetical protein